MLESRNNQSLIDSPGYVSYLSTVFRKILNNVRPQQAAQVHIAGIRERADGVAVDRDAEMGRREIVGAVAVAVGSEAVRIRSY